MADRHTRSATPRGDGASSLEDECRRSVRNAAALTLGVVRVILPHGPQKVSREMIRDRHVYVLLDWIARDVSVVQGTCTRSAICLYVWFHEQLLRGESKVTTLKWRMTKTSTQLGKKTMTNQNSDLPCNPPRRPKHRAMMPIIIPTVTMQEN